MNLEENNINLDENEDKSEVNKSNMFNLTEFKKPNEKDKPNNGIISNIQKPLIAIRSTNKNNKILKEYTVRKLFVDNPIDFCIISF